MITNYLNVKFINFFRENLQIFGKKSSLLRKDTLKRRRKGGRGKENQFYQSLI